RELLEICRGAGIRIVGPNCLGALNTADDVRLNATFAPHPALPGRVGFMSQSGGLGIATIEAAGRAGAGLASVVSGGNQAGLLGQAGVIRADTLHELLAVTRLLTTQPVPGGARVAIVTNAGGPGIMCADACQADGVEVPETPVHVQARLAEFLPAAASLRNPI